MILPAVFLALAGCMQVSPRYLRGTEYERAVMLYEGGKLLDARQKAQSIGKDDASYKPARKLVSEINSLMLQVSRRHMEMGEDFEKAGLYQSALAEYGTALAYNASNPLIQNKLVLLNEAIRDGRKLETEKPASLPVVVKKRASKEEKEDPEVSANLHYMKGKIYYETKAYNKAIEEFGLVLKFVPAYMNTSELLEKSKKEREAEVDRHLKNGIGYFQSEEMDLAIKEWDAVLELDAGNKKAADYKYRAEIILERLRRIREKKLGLERPL